MSAHLLITMGRPKLIRNEALLRIAREVFLESGTFGSTKDIARRAGISETAVFKRFPTKAALFLAAMAPPNVDPAAIARKAECAADAHASFAALGDAILAYFREALPVIVPLVRNPLVGFDALQKHFGTNPALILTETGTEVLRKLKKKGQINGDPRLAAAALVLCLHSVAQFEMMGFHHGAIPPKGVRAIIDTLWNGLRPVAAPNKAKRSLKR